MSTGIHFSPSAKGKMLHFKFLDSTKVNMHDSQFKIIPVLPALSQPPSQTEGVGGASEAMLGMSVLTDVIQTHKQSEV